MPSYRTIFYTGGNLLEPWYCVIEKLLVAFAEIAFSLAPIIAPAVSVFHTPTPADIEVPAYETLITEFLFVSGECSLFAVVGKFL